VVDLAERLRVDLLSPAGRAAGQVGRALFGAAVEQLEALSRAAGLPPPALPIGEAFPGRSEATTVLDAEHRLFDGARIRLWLAEQAGDAARLGNARAVFEELGAHPYLARASAVPGG
jgi:hypothetical protein